MTGTVLCVDPDDEARATTAAALRRATDGEVVPCPDLTREVVPCPDLATASDALGPAVDCVVSEFDLPDGSGLDLLAALRERAPDAGFVLFTDAAPDAIATSGLSATTAEYVPKGGPEAHDRLGELVAHTVRFRTQTAYPLPDDEEDRLAAVDAYRPILPAAEETFARLTSLARDLLDVPMATVGIVDDHEERFVACQGIDVDALPREDTVCTYALLEPGVTTISDLAADPRFADNERLTAVGIRAYAGANLTTAEGRVVATFCTFDREPREWTAADREHLELLAAEAMGSLELRRRLHEAADGAGPPTALDDRRMDAPPAAVPARDGDDEADADSGGEGR